MHMGGGLCGATHEHGTWGMGHQKHGTAVFLLLLLVFAAEEAFGWHVIGRNGRGELCDAMRCDGRDRQALQAHAGTFHILFRFDSFFFFFFFYLFFFFFSLLFSGFFFYMPALCPCIVLLFRNIHGRTIELVRSAASALMKYAVTIGHEVSTIWLVWLLFFFFFFLVKSGRRRYESFCVGLGRKAHLFDGAELNTDSGFRSFQQEIPLPLETIFIVWL